METATEEMHNQNAAMQAIHQAVLPGFIAAARAGHSAAQFLQYLEMCREGFTVCRAFNLSGENLAENLALELES